MKDIYQSKKQIFKKIAPIIHWIFICIYFICLFICNRNEDLIGFILTCGIFISVISMNHKIDKDTNISLPTLVSIVLILFMAVLIWNLYLIRKSISWSAFSLIAGILGIIILYYSLINTIILVWDELKKISKKTIKDFFYTNIGLFLICILFTFGSLPLLKSWLGNDGTIYQWGIVNAQENWDFYKIQYLNLGSHGGYAYCLFALLGYLIAPNTVSGIVFINILLAIITIIAFWIIIKKLCDNVSKLEQTLFTAIFAFSPMLYGLVGDINLEFPQLCFLTWLFAAYFCDNKWGKHISGLFLLFTKETAGLIYASFCLGEFITNINKEKNKNFFCGIFSVLKKMQFEVIIGLLFVFLQIKYNLFAANSSAANTAGKIMPNNNDIYLNDFSVWIDYISFKIKEIFIFNNNWVIWVCVLICLFRIFKIKKDLKIHRKFYMLGFFLSLLTFLFLQFFYVTWTNYRYIIPFLVYQGVITTYVICKGITNNKFRKIFIFIFLVTNILSNYYVHDFISEKIFLERNMGNGYAYIVNFFSLECLENQGDGRIAITKLLDKDISYTVGMRDMLVYNRQYSYLGNIYDQIMKDIKYEENILLIIPNFADDIEKTCSTALYRDAYILDCMYWNDKKGYFNTNIHRNTKFDYSKAGYKKVNIAVYDSVEDILNANKYKKIYCIYPHFNEKYNFTLFKGTTEMVLTKTYKKNIFRIELYELKTTNKR